jgi:hypothetical protein
MHDPDGPAQIVGPPPDERRCTAHISGGTPQRAHLAGQRCPQWAMTGTNVCYRHGGASPQARRGVITRAAMAKARDLMTTYGKKLDVAPLQVLLDEVQWTAGHVAWLREQVQAIESGTFAATVAEDPLVWGVTKRKTGGDDAGLTEEAVPNAILKLYQQERAHLVKACETAIRAGLDERMVRLAENQGQMVVAVIRNILGDLNLTAAQQALVSTVVPNRIRELHAQAALN